MQISQTRNFKKNAKKLHLNQKIDLDKAVKEIQKKPLIGVKKVGDLSMIRVYKFKMANQLTLLGYQYLESEQQIYLLAFGPHENFYRDLKQST